MSAHTSPTATATGNGRPLLQFSSRFEHGRCRCIDPFTDLRQFCRTAGIGSAECSASFGNVFQLFSSARDIYSVYWGGLRNDWRAMNFSPKAPLLTQLDQCAFMCPWHLHVRGPADRGHEGQATCSRVEAQALKAYFLDGMMRDEFVGIDGPVQELLSIMRRLHLLIGRRKAELAAQSGSDEPLTMVDVGAAEGGFSQLLRRLWCDDEPYPMHLASVYMFEPSHNEHALLRSILPCALNFTLIAAAASQSSGTQPLYLPTDPRVSSSLNRLALTPGPEVEQTQITTWALDDFAEDVGIREISILKIDTEGADLLVLRGAQGLLEQHRVQVLI